MAKPYSQDLHDRVLDAVDKEGMSRRSAAERFGIGEVFGDPSDSTAHGRWIAAAGGRGGPSSFQACAAPGVH